MTGFLILGYSWATIILSQLYEWGFENRILRQIFRPKRNVNGEWRRLHNEELHSSPNIVRVIKSKRLRWAEHVARMEEGTSTLKIITGKPTEKIPLGLGLEREKY